jgi:hypothetical protein
MADGFTPQGIWRPDGRAFSQGVIQGPGEVLHITGQVAWDASAEGGRRRRRHGRKRVDRSPCGAHDLTR